MAKVVVANSLERNGRTYKAGQVVEVSPGEARDLIALGKARPHATAVAKRAVRPTVKGVKP